MICFWLIGVFWKNVFDEDYEGYGKFLSITVRIFMTIMAAIYTVVLIVFSVFELPFFCVRVIKRQLEEDKKNIKKNQ